MKQISQTYQGRIQDLLRGSLSYYQAAVYNGEYNLSYAKHNQHAKHGNTRGSGGMPPQENFEKIGAQTLNLANSKHKSAHCRRYIICSLLAIIYSS